MSWPTALFLTLVFFVHFSVQFDKPVHIDDPHYVYAARHVFEQPHCPFCNTINWQQEPEPAYQDNINPPVGIYLQAVWIGIFGDSVRGLHLLGTLAVLAAAVFGLALARRFTRHPILATALFIFSPTLLPSTNLMLDVPALAIALAAIVLFVRGVDQGSRWLVGLGAFVAGLALLTKYNYFVLLPLLGFYAVLARRARHAVLLILPVAMLALWCLHNYLVYDGALHMLMAASFHPYEKTPIRWLENLCTAGMVLGSSFFLLAVTRLRRLDLRRFLFWGLPLGAVLWLAPLQFPWWGAPARDIRPEYLLFTANTLLLLALATAVGGGSGPRAPEEESQRLGVTVAGRHRPPGGGIPEEGDRWSRHTLFLGCWVTVVMVSLLLVAHHLAPRYHFLAFPAFAMLLVRALEGRSGFLRPLDRVLAPASLVLQLGVGLMVAAADDAHARANRDFPSAVKQKYPRATVSCIGHWGLQFYCEQLGFSVMDSVRPSVRKGALFIVPENSSRDNLPAVFKPLPEGQPLCHDQPLLRQLEAVEYPLDEEPSAASNGIFYGTLVLRWLYDRWPFAVMVPADNTSLYGTRLPNVPYSWRRRGRVRPNRGRPDFSERFLVLLARCDYQHHASSDRDARTGVETGGAAPGMRRGAPP